jgi:hypothetical protein
MRQAKPLGMEQIAAISRERGPCSRLPNTTARGVKGIANERVSRGGKVNSDLMWSPGFDANLDEAGVRMSFQNPNMAQGALSGGRDRMDRSEEWMRHRPDPRINGKAIHCRHATGQGPVRFLHLVASHGAAKSRSRSLGAREQNYSRSSATQSVNGCGFGIALSHQHKQRMLKESPSGNSWKAAWFCSCQHVLVLVKNSINQRRIRLTPGGTPPYKPLTGPQNSIGSCRKTIQ